MPSADESGVLRSIPVTRLMIGVAVGLPALWLGGVRPETVAVLAGIVCLLFVRFAAGTRKRLRIPKGLWIPGLVAGICALQWMPLPGPLASWLASDLIAATNEALTGSEVGSWGRISVLPGQTALEGLTALVLAGLYVASAQVSWRVTARATAIAGTTVAVIGLVQLGLGVDKILGVYQPLDRGIHPWEGMLTTFVNTNHQSSLFLLGSCVAAALVYEELRRAAGSGDAAEASQHIDRSMLFFGMLGIQTVGLLLSYSRGAILTLGLVAPLSIVLALRSGMVIRGGASTRKKLLTAVAILGVTVLLVGRLGTWEAMLSLEEIGDTDRKFSTVVAALDLVPFSPALGTGRGTFVALFPLVDPDPEWRVFTHIESFPVSAFVEWGPVAGALILGGMAVWAWQTFRYQTNTSQRLALLGVLAVAVHNLADFNLQFLGVAAPLVCVCGSLSPRRSGEFRTQPRAWLVAGAALVVAALAALAVPGSASRLRRTRLATVSPGEASQLLASSPLDPHLHLVLARGAATDGDWSRAEARATTVTRLLPSSVDGWLLLSAAQTQLGREEADASLARALANLRTQPDASLVTYLVTGRQPIDLAAIAPTDDAAWSLLVRALLEPAPEHATAIVERRIDERPTDPLALRFASRVALRRSRPALAIHHAKLLRQAVPERATSHLLLAEARRASGDHPGARTTLEEGLAQPELDDPSILQEVLANELVRAGDPSSLKRALELAREALKNADGTKTRRRRRELVSKIEKQLAPD